MSRGRRRLGSPCLQDRMEGLFLDHDNTTPATIAGGREIDEQCDDDARNRDWVPLPTEPMHNGRIPKRGEREEEETEDRPKDGFKPAVKPVGEEPQEDHG